MQARAHAHAHARAAQFKASPFPEADPTMSSAERAYIVANTTQPAGASAAALEHKASSGGGHFAPPIGNATTIPWGLLLSRKEVRACVHGRAQMEGKEGAQVHRRT